MSKKKILTIPTDLTLLYKSYVPALEVKEVKVNAVYFHKGESISNKSSFIIELIDTDCKVLPRMICEASINGDGYYIKNNLYLTEDEAYKRIAKNVNQVVEKSNLGILYVDNQTIAKNLEILKDNYPHYLI